MPRPTTPYMEKIPSFQINHDALEPGIYVSRLDYVGAEPVTTFDLRITRPNREPVVSTGGMHTIEHLGATYLRSDERVKSKIIYFGPMGCRTGCYLVVAGEIAPREILPSITDMCRYIISFEGEIPGAAHRDCGNWTDHSLADAKSAVKSYLATLENLEDKNCNYPK